MFSSLKRRLTGETSSSSHRSDRETSNNNTRKPSSSMELRFGSDANTKAVESHLYNRANSAPLSGAKSGHKGVGWSYATTTTTTTGSKQTPSRSTASSSSALTNTVRRLGSSSKDEELMLQWTQQVPHLAKFDSCIAAADALADSSNNSGNIDDNWNKEKTYDGKQDFSHDEENNNGTEGNETNRSSSSSLVDESLDDDDEDRNEAVVTNTTATATQSAPSSNSCLTRLDKKTGLVHTSVLVSPEGTLLLVPPGISRENLPFSNYFAIQRRLSLSTPTTSPQRQLRNEFRTPNERRRPGTTNNDQDKHNNDEATKESKGSETTQQKVEDAEKESQNATFASQNGGDTEDAEADAEGAKPTSPPNHRRPADGGHRSTHSFDSMDSRGSIFSELLWNSKGEYSAAVFLGHDLDPQGDAALNGFSAKGWSLPATNFALRQTQASLQYWAEFCQSVILARKETAVRTYQACDTLRSQIPNMGGQNPPGTNASTSTTSHYLYSTISNNNNDADWELVFDPKSDFSSTVRRSGPLLGTSESTANRALVLIEEYFSQSSEAESAAWRQATVQESAVIPQLRKGIDELQYRVTAREQALEESSKRVRLMEDRLNKLKKERDKKWEQVYKAEEKVTRRMEALWKERTRQREKARLVQLRETNTSHKPQKSNEQVWDVVASFSENNMDSTSFEPMQLPPDISVSSKSVSSDEGSGPTPLLSATLMEELNNKNSGINPIPSNANKLSEPSTISRETMEEEVRLPELRAIAMAADDAIEECATHLLTVLSNLDTTRRSARVAAETAMLAAANVQASTLTGMIKLERLALQERMRHLDQLETQISDVDVRADLNNYINTDKKDRGGQSHLGDDDDGGIASALAILSNHADSALHGDLSFYESSTMRDEDDDDDDHEFQGTDGKKGNKLISRVQIEQAVNDLFEEEEEEQLSTSESTKLINAVDLLCAVAKEKSKAARRKRSTMCYSLNSKRSGNAELKSKTQFDGLVKVFDAMLTSCANEDVVAGGMSNAKMLMMLAQTFYLPTDETDVTTLPVLRASSSMGSVGSDFESRKGRSRRLYIKSRLTGHKIWSKDEFWDVALKQQISESLTQSGVMSNFERSARAQRGGDGEYRKSRKIKWHDLSLEERVGAASQVHAVVFAQLGALAHSMIEFGCGLQRSCAFVRRMAIRHHLPSAQRTMLLQHLMARWDDEQSKQQGQEGNADDNCDED